jgi:hypothetical protein
MAGPPRRSPTRTADSARGLAAAVQLDQRKHALDLRAHALTGARPRRISPSMAQPRPRAILYRSTSLV